MRYVFVYTSALYYEFSSVTAIQLFTQMKNEQQLFFRRNGNGITADGRSQLALNEYLHLAFLCICSHGYRISNIERNKELET